MSATTIQPFRGSYLMPSLQHATVADAMHPGILSCEPDATLTEVARIMPTHHVHCIAMMGLTHEQPGEKLVWGLISDLDLLRVGIDNGAKTTAQALAVQPITAEATMPLLQAAELMVAHNASHLIVIDPRRQRPIGILSTLDIAGILAWGEA
jgi:CBS domain-containing protein